MENPFAVLSLVAGVLEQQRITYVVVGSLASSIHGISRSTADIDIVADVKSEQVIPLINALEGNFSVDERAVREAVDRRQSFNATHLSSAFNVDIFIAQADEFSKQQIKRRELREIAPDLKQKIYIATAEDTILAKLRSYKAAGRLPDTEWIDVLGIIGAASSTLDLAYLREWADKLDLTELLEKAIQEMKDHASGGSGQ